MSDEIELGMKTAMILSEIATERGRQIGVEGWTPDHDDTHVHGDLPRAAACYAIAAAGYPNDDRAIIRFWPWFDDFDTNWKPKDPRRNLIRAAALLVAEIERLDRLALTHETGTER